MKKKMEKKEALAKLEKRIDGMEAQACEDERRIGALQEQIQCSAQGHALWFLQVGCTCYGGTTYIFKCRCGLEISKSESELTTVEKTMLKKLKVI